MRRLALLMALLGALVLIVPAQAQEEALPTLTVGVAKHYTKKVLARRKVFHWHSRVGGVLIDCKRRLSRIERRCQVSYEAGRVKYRYNGHTYEYAH